MKDKSSISDRLLIFASIIIILAGLKLAAELVAPILFAFTLTVLIWPILEWLGKKGLPRWLAILIVAATLITCMTALIITVTDSLSQLSMNIPTYTLLLNRQLDPIAQFLSDLNIEVSLQGIGITGSALAQAGISFASGVVSSAISIIMFLVLLVLMIIASDSVVKSYNRLSGKKSSFSKDFTSWSKGIQVQYRVQTMNNLIVGLLITLLFLAMGVDYAILWGFLAFLLSYIPNLGLVIASIPPVILTLIFYGWPTAIFAAVFIIVLNFVMDNIVTPRFIGAELKVPAVYIFISFLFCSYMFGILGAFLSLPIFLALRQALIMNPKTKAIGEMLGHFTQKKAKARN